VWRIDRETNRFKEKQSHPFGTSRAVGVG
jgi:hypothetical protein